eukprot:CAMPEP_0173311088 /NCGR_PEP_ID=MMETSP1143-20121109/23314_1 /TAXON_ID=483371 /ORGANISM="non described non described, Strain CCMP2298" /LENGTH=65 /DNA_ID=CAMNT_0014252997 /DNA_START=109 /DNA_END=307 /DNA_ORIENTATION=-
MPFQHTQGQVLVQQIPHGHMARPAAAPAPAALEPVETVAKRGAMEVEELVDTVEDQQARATSPHV